MKAPLHDIAARLREAADLLSQDPSAARALVVGALRALDTSPTPRRQRRRRKAEELLPLRWHRADEPGRPWVAFEGLCWTVHRLQGGTWCRSRRGNSSKLWWAKAHANRALRRAQAAAEDADPDAPYRRAA